MKPGTTLTPRKVVEVADVADDPAFTRFIERVRNTSDFRRAMVSPKEWRRLMVIYAMGWADHQKHVGTTVVPFSTASPIVGGRFA